MSILLLIVEIAVPRALGSVPPAPKTQLSLLPVCESFSSYFSYFLTLLRTGNDVAEMHKTHPKTVLSPSLVPCCHLPWSPLQLFQHEQELSQSDFSPMGAERFRHLLWKASWEVSNFFFFCKCKMFSCTLGKHPSLRLFILKLFWGWIASSTQSPFAQLLNVSEFTSDLCTREARLPPVPNAEETAVLHFSHSIPGKVFCLPLRGKLEKTKPSS